jgi:hypothetical protein
MSTPSPTPTYDASDHELSDTARILIGFGVCVVVLFSFLLLPGLRAYLAHESESTSKKLLIARGLALFSLCLRVGDIFSDLYEAGDSSFECRLVSRRC